MDRVSRGISRLKPKGKDYSTVATFMRDYDEALEMIKKLVEASKQWRDAWSTILTSQFNISSELYTLFCPIVGAGDTYEGHEPVETSEEKMTQAHNLAQAFEELKVDLMSEVNMVDERIMRPALDAQTSLLMLKKTIKRRDDRKNDHDKFLRKVDDLRRKLKRSDRENATLEKTEMELERAKGEWMEVEDHLHDHLPPLVRSVFSLLPYLLTNLIMIQNNLCAHYYTTLHNYCADEGFPDPAPAPEEIIAAWEEAFKPAVKDLESQLQTISKVRRVNAPLRLEANKSSSNLTIRSRDDALTRRNSNISNYSAQSIKAPPPPPPSMSMPSRSMTAPSSSQNSIARISSTTSSSSYQRDLDSPGGAYLSPVSTQPVHSPAAPNADYFARGAGMHPNGSSLSVQSLANMAAGKKKPPPPPPPRKLGADQRFVTAIYAFEGEAPGDLQFKEGDRIRVIKGTESMDDWWQGELNGVKGSFPANYCSPG